MRDSLDPVIQQIAEEELRNGLQRSGARRGHTLMIDPHTGEILSFAEYPSMQRKMLFETREPGSVFKLINYAICLSANEKLLSDGEDSLFSPNQWIPHCKNISSEDLSPTKLLNLNVAIQKSSNNYPIQIVNQLVKKMGAAWYLNQLKETFRFGERVVPEDQSGWLPTPGSFHANGNPHWYSNTPQALAIGYNLTATSLQLVQAYATIANRGIRPSLERKGKRVLSIETCNILIEAMELVVQEGGTSPLGNIPGYRTAGKSGSVRKFIDGRYIKDRNFASFIGFAPAESPAFVLLVVLDEPVVKLTEHGPMNHGGTSAASIFREIGLRSLSIYNLLKNFLFIKTFKVS